MCVADRPHVALRIVIAPVHGPFDLVLGTGVALLAVGETHGLLVGLHKASFIVWSGGRGRHVLAHAAKLPRLLRQRFAGTAQRAVVVAGAIAAGAVLATATLPRADQLQDRVTAQLGVDSR